VGSDGEKEDSKKINGFLSLLIYCPQGAGWSSFANVLAKFEVSSSFCMRHYWPIDEDDVER
jgi:hypothetical protein